MDSSSVAIPKVWRSELSLLVTFFLLCILSVVLSSYIEGSVIPGRLFGLGSSVVILKFPLFWLLPLSAWILMIFRMYDVRYRADSRGLEAISGILSLKQRITRVRYEDIRSIETEQTIIERMLDVGDVEVGTAATSGIEMTLFGVGAPCEVRDMIQIERDRREQLDQRAMIQQKEPEPLRPAIGGESQV